MKFAFYKCRDSDAITIVFIYETMAIYTGKPKRKIWLLESILDKNLRSLSSNIFQSVRHIRMSPLSYNIRIVAQCAISMSLFLKESTFSKIFRSLKIFEIDTIKMT